MAGAFMPSRSNNCRILFMMSEPVPKILNGNSALSVKYQYMEEITKSARTSNETTQESCIPRPTAALSIKPRSFLLLTTTISVPEWSTLCMLPLLQLLFQNTWGLTNSWPEPLQWAMISAMHLSAIMEKTV